MQDIAVIMGRFVLMYQNIVEYCMKYYLLVTRFNTEIANGASLFGLTH